MRCEKAGFTAELDLKLVLKTFFVRPWSMVSA